VRYHSRVLREVLTIIVCGLAFLASASARSAGFEPLGEVYVTRAAGTIVAVSADAISFADATTARSFRWRTPHPGVIYGESAGGDQVHYYIGDRPETWRAGIPRYNRVRRRELYGGIDAVYYWNGGALEFDLVVHPGAVLDRAALRPPAGFAFAIGASGEAVARRGGDSIRFRAPQAYQLRDGARVRVPSTYILSRAGDLRFAAGPYDHTRDLIVDPVVEAMTYLGGNGIDEPQAVGVDAAGNVVIAGVTTSANFPGASGLAASTVSIFVTKLNATASAVLFTSMLGSRAIASATSVFEHVSSLAIDSDGDIYVAGTTLAANFPTTAGAWRRTAPGGFATRLDSEGKLVYSTMLGTDASTLTPIQLRVRNGIAYVAGEASRPEFFGTAGAFQRNVAGSSDLFVLALPPDGGPPAFLTAFGGSGAESLHDLAFAANGDVLLAGSTSSTDLPRTPDALASPGPIAPASVGMLVRLDSSGSRLVFSTYLGSNAASIAATPDGNYAVVGAGSMPAGAPLRSALLPGQKPAGFLAEFSSVSNQPLWIATLGSSTASQLSVGERGDFYFMDAIPFISGGGLTPFSSTPEVMKLSPDGATMLYASPLSFAAGLLNGGRLSITPTATGIAVAGATSSALLPATPGAFQAARDPAPPGDFRTPLNFDDGFVGVLDLSSFTAGNFFVGSTALSLTWRVGEPAPVPVTLPVVTSGDPGPITATGSTGVTAAYSATPSPSVSVNVNTAQTVAGSYRESVRLQASNPDSALSVPVTVTVLPRVGFDLDSSQVDIRLRHGQGRSTATLPTVGITTDFAGGYFNFDVSSDSPWLRGSVATVSATRSTLSLYVSDLDAGVYDGVLTLRLSGLQNVVRTLKVHYVVDPAVPIQLSTTTINLHIVKGQPIVPAVVAVTSSVPGVAWSIFVGVSRTWLQVTASNHATPGEIRITADPATVEIGTFAFAMFVSGEGDQRIQATIVVDVSSGAPFDAVPNTVDYLFQRGGPYGQVQQLIAFTAPSPLVIQWSTDQPWLLPRQGSGTTPFGIALAFDSTLPEGVYHGNVIARGGNSTVTIPVTWELYDIPHLTYPADPIAFRYQIGGPAPAPKQVTITSPTLKPGYVQAGTSQYPSFITLDPPYGPTPLTMKVTPDVQGRAPGTYKTNILIGAGYPDTRQYPPIPVTLDVIADPNAATFSISQLVDAASFLAGAVSPGEIVTIFGSGMGPAPLAQAQPGADSRFPTTLAGGTFYFDELPAPVIYLSATQAAVVAPFGLAGRTHADVTFEYGGKRSAPLRVSVAASNPGVFTAGASGSGPAAAQNVASDGSVSAHDAAHPVSRGGIVTLYATGLGTVSPTPPDGALSTAPLPALVTTPRVLVAGQEATVLYAGPAPGLIAGLMQINIRVPDGAPAGNATLLVISGDNPSQPGVTLAVR
jgi:uncharacterized protein (TIGR03437 family)